MLIIAWTRAIKPQAFPIVCGNHVIGAEGLAGGAFDEVSEWNGVQTDLGQRNMRACTGRGIGGFTAGSVREKISWKERFWRLRSSDTSDNVSGLFSGV